MKWSIVPNQKIESISVSIFGEGLGGSYYSLTGMATSSNSGIMDFKLPQEISGPIPGKYKIVIGLNCPGWFASFSDMSRSCPLFGVSANPFTITASSVIPQTSSGAIPKSTPPPLVQIQNPTTPQTLIRVQGPFAFGMRNDEVKKLQEMLSKDPTIYQGEITGYYGTLTVEAVKKFQKKYGIITAGTSDTTGYGLAGPTTRAKINEVFGAPVSSPTPNTTQDMESLKKQVAQLLEQLKALQNQLLIMKLTQVNVGF